MDPIRNPCTCPVCTKNREENAKRDAEFEAQAKDLLKTARPVTKAEAAAVPAMPLTVDQYCEMSMDLLGEASDIEAAKRPSYTGASQDVLANFRRIAALTGQTPGEVLATYMMKHVLSVCTSLTNPEVKDPESLKGRFADNINYLKLGWAMLQHGVAHEKQS